MAETTRDSTLMRISDFQRQQGEGDTAAPAEASAGTTRLASLNPSLLQDLMRPERRQRPGEGLDVLEVLAAALRHGRALSVFLQLDYRVIPLQVRPRDRVYATPLPPARLLTLRLPDLRVLRVEPAPPESDAGPDDVPFHPAPLAPLLWELALRGMREVLLPEIAGLAAYRVVPGADLALLDLSGTMGTAIARLREQTTPLQAIARWPGFDRSRAVRMLNGLYLLAALRVTRTHPGALE